jgi:hypothetical protein
LLYMDNERSKSIEIAKARVKDIDDILRNMADMVKLKRMHIRSFWAATALHLQNYYMNRSDIIEYLESRGFPEDHPKVKKFYPKQYLVERGTQKLYRECEYWESVEGYVRVAEYKLPKQDN